jgi:hypothetical protein
VHNERLKKEVRHLQKHSIKRLSQILGPWFVEEDPHESGRVKKVLGKMSKLTSMRHVKLESMNIATIECISELLYEEAIRIFNEHSMRLILDHSPSFKRDLAEGKELENFLATHLGIIKQKLQI